MQVRVITSRRKKKKKELRSPGAAASRGSEGAARRHASHLHRGDNAELPSPARREALG